MSDKFTTSMSPSELVKYMRCTHRKYEGELPDKLIEWSWKFLESNTGLTKETYHRAFEICAKEPGNNPDNTLRQEIATRILVRHAPAATINPESLADYCVEAADELIKRLKR